MGLVSQLSLRLTLAPACKGKHQICEAGAVKGYGRRQALWAVLSLVLVPPGAGKEELPPAFPWEQGMVAAARTQERPKPRGERMGSYCCSFPQEMLSSGLIYFQTLEDTLCGQGESFPA